MDKRTYLETLKTLYRVSNRADNDDKRIDESWTHPDMAGNAGCAEFDAVFAALKDCGVLSSDEYQEIYDTL